MFIFKGLNFSIKIGLKKVILRYITVSDAVSRVVIAMSDGVFRNFIRLVLKIFCINSKLETKNINKKWNLKRNAFELPIEVIKESENIELI